MTKMNNSNEILRLVESTLIPHTAFQSALARITQALAHAPGSSEPTGIALVGEARTGKTRVLEEADMLLTRSRTSEGAFVPILRMRTPSHPTVKGVASLLLRMLGDPKWERGTEVGMSVRLIDMMGACRTQMLMVDEFQHFFDKGTHKIFHEVADWLKNLMDETKVVVVVSGLEECLPVLRGNEQLTGRFNKPIFMRRFLWDDVNSMAEFLGILQAFHEALYDHLEMPNLASPEMAFRCWYATGGLIGLLAKILRQAVWNAVDARVRTIDLEGLRAAHELAAWDELGERPGPSPFARSFSVEPSAEKIAQALRLGRREEPTNLRRAHIPKRKGPDDRSGTEAVR